MTDRTWELMHTHLDGDFRIMPMAPFKTSRQEISDIEKSLGIKLPEEYKSHLLGDGDDKLEGRGIFIEVNEDIWQRPKMFDVGPFWSFLYGLHTYTACKESNDWMRLEVVGHDFLKDTGIKAVPILKIIGDADVYCVNEKSQIAIYRHEENILEDTNLTFWEALDFELKELKERKEKKIKEHK